MFHYNGENWLTTEAKRIPLNHLSLFDFIISDIVHYAKHIRDDMSRVDGCLRMAENENYNLFV